MEQYFQKDCFESLKTIVGEISKGEDCAWADGEEQIELVGHSGEEGGDMMMPTVRVLCPIYGV